MKSIPTKMLLWSVGMYHRVLDFFNSLCHSNKDVVDYTSRWILCNPTTDEKYLSETRESLFSNDEFPILIHEVVYGNTVRMAVHHNSISRDPYFVENLFIKPCAPWLFIGYRSDEGTVDCTDVMSEFVCEGNYITQELLYSALPESRGQQWVYLHPKTFEESDFPSEGILITEDEQAEGGDKKND
jgi:hypothetical protein